MRLALRLRTFSFDVILFGGKAFFVYLNTGLIVFLMETSIIIYEHIWCFALVIAVVGAIFYFIRVLKTSYCGEDENCEYIGKFYEKGEPSFRLKPQKNELKPILILIGIYFAVRISTTALAFVIKSVIAEGYTFKLTDLFVELTKWDSHHYIGIAEKGYQNEGDPRFHIVFYPLYPLIVRGLSYLFGGSVRVAAFVEPNIFMALSIAVMYKLLRIDFSQKTTITAILLLIFNPFAFFFSLPFTESTFLFLSLLFMFMLKKENWLAAGICGFFAALTKNFGLIFIIPYGVHLITVACKRHYKEKDFISKLLPAFLVLAGFGVYLIINKVVTGNWFQFMIYQKEHWYNEISCILKNVTNHFRWFISENASPDKKWFLWFGNVSAAVLTMTAVFIKHKKMPFLYNIYALAYLFLTLTVSWLLSGARYLMASFPAYIAYALALDDYKWLRWTVIAVEYILGIAVMTAFLMNAYIM